MHSFCSRCRGSRVQAPRNMIHRWLDSVLAYANTTGCGAFSWGWDVRTLQQSKCRHQLLSTSGGRVALQVDSRAAARSAWTASLTVLAWFNHCGAHGAQEAAWNEAVLLRNPLWCTATSTEWLTEAEQLGHSTPVLVWAMQHTAAPNSQTVLSLTAQWKNWWDGSTRSHSQ